MLLHIHHYNHTDKVTAEQLSRIHQMLSHIWLRMEKIMSTFDDLKAAQAETLNQIGKVKGDLEALIAKLAAIPAAGLTAEQQTALDDAVTHATAINTALAAVDTEANPPAPPAQ